MPAGGIILKAVRFCQFLIARRRAGMIEYRKEGSRQRDAAAKKTPKGGIGKRRSGERKGRRIGGLKEAWNGWQTGLSETAARF